MHENEKALCNICGKPLRKSTAAIAQHMKDVHSSEKAKCPVCGAKFAQMKNLKRHQTKCSANKKDN